MSDETVSGERWLEAEKHTREVKADYDELVGTPGVITGFALTFINGYLDRYANGERTRKLYDDMHGCK